MKFINFSFLLFIIFFNKTWAGQEPESQGLTVVAIGEAQLEQDRLLIDNPEFSSLVSAKDRAEGQSFMAIIRNDFAFYKNKFSVLEVKSESSTVDKNINFSELNNKSVRYVLRSTLLSGPSLEVELYDVLKKEKLLAKQHNIIPGSRSSAHALANEIYKVILKKDAIFNSKIIFVSDKTSSANVIRKEVYMMDFDGKGLRQLTFHEGVVISPDISPDGQRIIYSLIRPGKQNRNIDLYEMDLNTKKSQLVSSRKGINSGAIYLPDGKHIILTLSHTGNAEIYKMNLANGQIEAITHHSAADVDPSFNSDGTQMAFLSDRPGKAMIYTLDPRGVEKDVKRIGFVGQFNATPRFAPSGKEIVFSSWLDDRFDLFRLNSDGQGLVRLTKDFGSNEEPSYSPDGEFIIFTSQRILSRKKAIQDVYIMDRDGEIIGPLTSEMGNCLTPRWSK